MVVKDAVSENETQRLAPMPREQGELDFFEIRIWPASSAGRTHELVLRGHQRTQCTHFCSLESSAQSSRAIGVVPSR